MKLIGVLIYLALAASCSNGATRHRHETRQIPFEDDIEPDAPDDSQLYQQSVAFGDEDSVAADNIKTVFGGNRQTQRTYPRSRPQTRSRPTSWSSRVGSGTAVRRTQVQQRAQSLCPQTPARRANPVYYPPPMPSFSGYPGLPWWPSWNSFPGFPVYIPVPVPVPVCNCTTQEDTPSTFDGRLNVPPIEDYEDIEPAPLDFAPATTPRPLGFNPPSVDRKPLANNPTPKEEPQQLVPPRLPTSSGTKKNQRQGGPRCARAIVNCCDLQADLKCFEIFGCGGAIFGDPCIYYESALKALTKYENDNSNK